MKLEEIIGYLISFISAAIVATWRLASLKSEFELKIEQLKNLIKQETDYTHDKLIERISSLEHQAKINDITLSSEMKDQKNKINSLARTSKTNFDNISVLINDIQDYLARSTSQCDMPFRVRRKDAGKVTLNEDESWSRID